MRYCVMYGESYHVMYGVRYRMRYRMRYRVRYDVRCESLSCWAVCDIQFSCFLQAATEAKKP